MLSGVFLLLFFTKLTKYIKLKGSWQVVDDAEVLFFFGFFSQEFKTNAV